MGLVLSNSNFLMNKNSQGRKSVGEKSTYYFKFGFCNCIIQRKKLVRAVIGSIMPLHLKLEKSTNLIKRGEEGNAKK